MSLLETLVSVGGPEQSLSDAEIDKTFSAALNRVLGEIPGGKGPVLLLPPDITRFHSRAGFLTCIAYRELCKAGVPALVMPALGTHMAMTSEEIGRMFQGIPVEKFLVHDWRNDVVELGRIEKGWIEKAAKGAVSYDWPVQVNKILRDGGFSLIISLGQVVPHEVAGMANHAKNIFVGTGGKEGIDKSHFAGAAFGMERIMGRADTPVRAMFDEGLRRFAGELPPVFYALTVIGPCGNSTALRGLFAGFGRECFEKAASLSRMVNVDLLDEPVKKAVVYLDPDEYRTTWLGNKAVYRTRMAMADGGELLILAPGLERFGEDRDIDALIRCYGYRPAKIIREKAEAEKDLGSSLSAAAHLIHGSSEGRFTVRYCPGPAVSRFEIESVGYEWGDINEALSRYKPANLKHGWNVHTDGERFFYISNPALGLWALREQF
ncbi:MAG: lactate racemase domain-containing protein [Treponema sp.]|nr:lactate racemase domain-containing protein [Treponema sp.]